MSRKRRKRGITPWKKTALRVCFLWLLLAAGLHLFRLWKVTKFEDQGEAARWGSESRCAQVSAFLPDQNALKEDGVRELESKINTALAQDSIKLTAEGPDARLWQDCYSGVGSLSLKAGTKTVDVEAVGTGGAFFTFHPLKVVSGSVYSTDSLMKDEILLDEETAWKLFGAFDVEGRTVQVQDMSLRISGVYHKEKGKLYEQAGLPEYVAFVQYKTLLQYGGGTGSDTSSTETGFESRGIRRNGTQLIPSTATAASDGGLSVELDEGAQESGGDDASGSSGDAGTETYTGETSSGDAGAADTTSDGTTSDGTASGTPNENTQSMENVGTSNTAFRDTGKITVYEIVMPDPVEGYAANVLANALGEEAEAVVVDNTNRFGERSLLTDLRDFAYLGMRTQPVRYPYWENVAMGWETIFAALLLLECLLILMTVLLLVWMVIHWYRHKTWTLAGNIRNMQDSLYEKQSRKRYPEYYEEKDEEEFEDDEEDSSKGSGSSKDKKKTDLLEDKGAVPFERIPENRKAVQYETTHRNDQHSVGSGSGPDTDGVRRRQQ